MTSASARLRLPISANHLFYGDNLEILRDHIPDESVDLVYLDPPFNSQATYNVLFRAPTGEKSRAQIEAFEDTWGWETTRAEEAFDAVMSSENTDVAEMLRSIRGFLKENDMMAYLTMMAVRLLELHRVLKSSGSLYLHCDPTASHYLKILVDAVFGPENFQNEIIWKRTSSANNPKRWGPVHDTILFYTKSAHFTWNTVLQEFGKNYLASKYKYRDGRGIYRLSDLTASGIRTGDSGQPWKNFDPTPLGRHWAAPSEVIKSLGGSADASTQTKLDLLDKNEFIYWTPGRNGKPGFPQFKRYLPPGQVIQDTITDIPPINSMAKERLGYPTQKPVELLERIISASSNSGEIVLDPFCGCGTSIHAAQKLGRKWIGIDVTHLAISLIEKRLKAFHGLKYTVHGVPTDPSGAAALAHADKHQFQLWAVSRIEAQPFKGGKKGADSGIDGLIYFKPDGKTTERAVVSVKGGGNVTVAMIRDLAHVVDREKAKVGVFITLAPPTGPMKTEAVKAGFYEPPHHPKVPKIQIFTVEDLFAGKKPLLPLVDTTIFKRAVQEQPSQSELF